MSRVMHATRWRMNYGKPQAELYLLAAERLAAGADHSRTTPERQAFRKVGVVGAGTMGSGIAMALCDAGIPTVIVESEKAPLIRGLESIRNNYEISRSRGRLSAAEIETRMALLTTSLEYGALEEADLVIEAVFENLDLKQAVFRKLDLVCKPGALLATNTSTLDVNAIASVTQRPTNVLGLHFFSPANVMKLLEIVRATRTSLDAIVSGLALARQIGKTAVVVGVGFGFVGNRMLEPYAREAHRLLLEGATVRQIEGVLTDFGFKMDPLSMYDLAGIDVGHSVRESRRAAFAQDPSYQIMGDKLYALGRYGMKTGRGFYRYDGRTKLDDPEVDALALGTAIELGVRRRGIANHEILERCIYALINEGAEALRVGVAFRASDCDVIWCNGYGFPRTRGGPMYYADTIGLERVLTAIERYRAALGEYGQAWFNPSPLLVQLVRDRKTFAAFDGDVIANRLDMPHATGV